MCDPHDFPDPLRLGRSIFIRRHGDGFTVSVEPHPVGDSLNRRCRTYMAALAWAKGTEQRKAWPIVDEVHPALPSSDARPEYGRGVVHLDGNGDEWVVRLSPRPWGWADLTKQFFRPVSANACADELRQRVKLHELKQREWRNRKRRAR